MRLAKKSWCLKTMLHLSIAQEIVNLLNGSDNENSTFSAKKWYIIDSESKGNHSDENEVTF